MWLSKLPTERWSAVRERNIAVWHLGNHFFHNACVRRALATLLKQSCSWDWRERASGTKGRLINAAHPLCHIGVSQFYGVQDLCSLNLHHAMGQMRSLLGFHRIFGPCDRFHTAARRLLGAVVHQGSSCWSKIHPPIRPLGAFAQWKFFFCIVHGVRMCVYSLVDRCRLRGFGVVSIKLMNMLRFLTDWSSIAFSS